MIVLGVILLVLGLVLGLGLLVTLGLVLLVIGVVLMALSFVPAPSANARPWYRRRWY
jgi:hypothetical protein